jgi:peptidylprolyl isomerase/FKBP-type peptidyl-prolyl cis-trans isomerase FklB
MNKTKTGYNSKKRFGEWGVMIQLTLLLFLSLSFATCDDDDGIDPAWRNANEEAYIKTAVDSLNYQEIVTESGPSGVFYKVIESGNRPAEFPLQTSKVKVFYEGTFYNKTVFDAGTSSVVYEEYTSLDKLPETGKTNVVYLIYQGGYYDAYRWADKKYEPSLLSNYAVEFGLSSVVRGFSFALQNMVVGDKWEIWIPWHLGYGNSTYATIPAYSTLIFKVKLLGVTQYPD